MSWRMSNLEKYGYFVSLSPKQFRQLYDALVIGFRVIYAVLVLFDQPSYLKILS